MNNGDLQNESIFEDKRYRYACIHTDINRVLVRIGERVKGVNGQENGTG